MVTARPYSRRRRHPQHPRWRRQLTHEPLESRYLLDTGLAALGDDFFESRQNGPMQTLEVLSNDEIEGPGIRIASVSYGSQGGQVDISSDGLSVQYTPPADFAGTEQFVYFVDDQGAATVTVEVVSPVAFDTYEIMPDGEQRVLHVMANDKFWPDYAGPRQITLLSETSGGGEVTIAPDGKAILYTPPQPEPGSGKDSFVYIVDDMYPARVTVDIPSPLAYDRVEVLQNSQSNALQVLRNDPLWRDYLGPREITGVTATRLGGTVTIVNQGKDVVYTPPADVTGWDHFAYVVDGMFEADVDVVIHRPAVDDYYEVDENSVGYVLRDVTANDKYYDLSRRWQDIVDRVTSVNETEHDATVGIMADGRSLRYTPPAGFAGTDQFTYIADGKYPATVRVHVSRPVRDDHLSVFEDTTTNVLGVLDNDFYGNGYPGLKRITEVSDTSHGGRVAISPRADHLVYSPPAGFRGTDTFTYLVDGQLEANVTVHVAPLTAGDSFRFCPSPNAQVHVLDVLGNDHFRGNYQGPVVITSVSQPETGGEVSIAGDGKSLRFAPELSGYHSFTYTVDQRYEGSVSVGIQNHLSGDQMVVDQNSSDSRLDLLENDFTYRYGNCPASTYRGPRSITAVGSTDQGGTVTIVDDGARVRYTPPADFHGSDQFTYTVDGVMQATTRVEVVRRVRDDQFHVLPDSDKNGLPVLVNDGFGAEYAGPRQITSVTSTAEGGSATLAEDGSSILYSPPAGFSGTDTFTYTVDDALKAEVVVTVTASMAETSVRFGSMDEFQKFLVDDALARYAGLFGTETYPYDYTRYGESGLTDAVAAGGASRSHSETNVQVEGVDEADIIETDSDFLYVLTGNELVIADAWPADELSEASRTTIDGVLVGEYLHGDRLTVISRQYESYYPYPELYVDDISADFAPGVARIDGLYPWPYPQDETTIVTVLDVTDRAAPTVVRKTEIDGRYIESRSIDGTAFVVVDNDNFRLPPPKWTPLEDTPSPDGIQPAGDLRIWPPQPPGVYETEAEYLARIGELIEETVPRYSSYRADGQLLETGLLNEPEHIFKPLSPESTDLVSVVTIDAGSDQPGVRSTSAVFATGANVVYATLEHLYVFDVGYSEETGPTTSILKFDWDAAAKDVQFAAKGWVPGRMLNQFSADEFDGQLRIATNVSNSWSGTWSNRSQNDLYVLQEDVGLLEPVGSLQNLALDESIRSVRFMGDRAFVTTFRDIDPLFGLDLSDPHNPESVGHLTLPGFSSYMQFIDDTHLLSVGRNTPNGWSGPAQVTLFDVSDLTHPVLIDEYTFARFSTTEAAVDHHAFGYYAEHSMLAMPVSRSYWERTDEDGDGYRETRSRIQENDLVVFHIDASPAGRSDEGIQLLGEITHDSPVRRSAYIDDKLYSVAEDSVKAVEVTAPATVLAELVIASDDPNDVDDPLTPRPTSQIDLAWRMAGVAKDHLSEGSSIERGEVVALASQSVVVSNGQSGGYQIELRIDDTRYTYLTDDNQTVLYATASSSTVAVTELNYHPSEPTAAELAVDPSLVSDDFEFIEIANWGANPTNMNGIELTGGVQYTFPDIQLDSGQRAVVVRNAAAFSLRYGDDAIVVGQYEGTLNDSQGQLVLRNANGDSISDLDYHGQQHPEADGAGFTLVRNAAMSPALGQDSWRPSARLGGSPGEEEPFVPQPGDSNRDGKFDQLDLVFALQGAKYMSGQNATFAEGDWNLDGVFNQLDIIEALKTGLYLEGSYV